MPTVSEYQAFTPLVLKEARPPSPSAETLTWRNVSQGNVGDCWDIVGEAMLAEIRPELQAPTVRGFTTTDDDGVSQRRYCVRQYLPDNKDGVLHLHEQWVDGRLYAHASDGRFILAGDREGSIDPESPGLWLAIKEKAYAFRRTGAPDYGIVQTGNADETFNTALGDGHGKSWAFSKEDPDDIVLTSLQRVLANSLPITALTRQEPEGFGESVLYHGHVYGLLGLETGDDGTLRVRLVNLHKPSRATGDKPRENPLSRRAMKPWLSESELEYRDRPRAIGEFPLSFAEFKDYFQRIDYCDGVPLKVTAESLARANLASKNEIP
jgi:hypothetical protein